MTNPNPQAMTGLRVVDENGNCVHHRASNGHQFSTKQSTTLILQRIFLTTFKTQMVERIVKNVSSG